MSRMISRATVIPVALCALLLILIFAAFGESLSHAFAPIDDEYLVLHNLAVHGVTLPHLRHIFTSFDPELYIPLTLFSYQLNFAIGGLYPFGYHLVNLLFHAANAVLVFFLFRRLTLPVLYAFLAAALFAIHPIQTEAVVWIAARKELLMTFFALCSFQAYLWPKHSTDSRILCVAFLLLALLSKVTVAVLPLIFLAYDLLLAQRSRSAALLYEKIPHFFLVILFIGITLIGKAPAGTVVHLPMTILLMLQSIALTLFHIVVPVSLSPLYEVIPPVAFFSLAMLLSSITLITFVLLLIIFLKRLPHAAFGFLFFLLALLPTLFTFRHGDALLMTADRYAYLPIIGMCFFFGTILFSFSSSIRTHSFRKLPACILALLLLPLFILTRSTTHNWSSSDALFTAALARDPATVSARIGLANVQRERGDPYGAFKTLREGLRFGDDPRLHLAAGIVYIAAGRTDDALAQFALVEKQDPINPEPAYYRGLLLEQQDDASGAITLYRTALSLDPSFVSAHAHLGRLLLLAGNTLEATTEIMTALSYNPNDVESLAVFGELMSRRGDTAAADATFADALSLEKYSVPTLLARARHELRQHQSVAAQETLKLVLRIEDKNPEALQLLKQIGGGGEE